MIKAKKILFVTQEMMPYVPETVMATMGRRLPQATQEKSREIRTFMPKWGIINERRNQLHEVIRLSGMNLIIDDNDHPLIIKVASIAAARMQVYFIDNEDFFNKRLMATDEEGKEYKDNIERAVFFARGVLETIKKLKWVPEVIHCQGWISGILPLYLRTAYAEEPSFRDCRIVFTPSDEGFTCPVPDNLEGTLEFRNASINDVKDIQEDRAAALVNKIGIKFSDGIAMQNEDDEYAEFARSLGKPVLPMQSVEDYGTAFPPFFDQVWSEGKPEVVEEDDDF